MKLLILGGTAWLGRTAAATAIAVGHDVTCLARGSDVPAGAVLISKAKAIADADYTGKTDADRSWAWSPVK